MHRHRQNGQCLKALCTHLGVSPRTLYRYLNGLEKVGVEFIKLRTNDGIQYQIKKSPLDNP